MAPPNVLLALAELPEKVLLLIVSGPVEPYRIAPPPLAIVATVLPMKVLLLINKAYPQK